MLSSYIIRTVVILLAATLATACDDDDKKTRYKIEIEMSDNIDWEIKTFKAKDKPEVTVSYPKGVQVRGRETKPAKTVSFAPLSTMLLVLFGSLALLATTGMRAGCLPLCGTNTRGW